MSIDHSAAPQETRPDLSALRIPRETPRRRGRGGRGLVWLIVVVLLAAVAWWVITNREQFLPAPQVTVMTVVPQAPGTPDTLLSASGYVVAHRQAAVTAKVTGKIAEIRVDEGDRVQPGQVLAVLEQAEIRAQQRETAAQLREAREQWREAREQHKLDTLERARQTALLERGVTSRADYDRAVTAADVQAARVASLEARAAGLEARRDVLTANLADTVVRAPFGGTVVARNGEVGEAVSVVSLAGQQTGSGIVVLTDMDSLEVEVDVAEVNLGKVREGQPATVALDAFPGRTWAARLRQIVPTANRQKAVVQVKVDFLEDKTGVLPDMSAQVTFVEETAPTPAAAADAPPRIFVPEGAVVRTEGGTRVRLVEDAAVRFRPVEVGPPNRGQVEVLTGLSGGERVVVSGPEDLDEGDRVQVR